MEMRTSRWLAYTLPPALALAIVGCQKQTLDTSRPGSARALSGTLTGDPAVLQQDDGQWVTVSYTHLTLPTKRIV